VRVVTPDLKAAARALGGEVSGGQVLCPGPGHSSKDRSLSVRFSPDAPDGFVVNSFSNDDFGDCRDCVREKLGLPAAKGEARKVEVESYRYENESGVLQYETVRYNFRFLDGSIELDGGKPRKKFLARRQDESSNWIYKVKGFIDPVPYKLPQLQNAIRCLRRIYLVEGERKADRLRALGLEATCNPFGCKWEWTDKFVEYFRGAEIIILADHDGPGRAWAAECVRFLAGVAFSIKIVSLGLTREGDDIVDWLDAGHTAEELLAIVDAPAVPAPTHDAYHEQRVWSTPRIEEVTDPAEITAIRKAAPPEEPKCEPPKGGPKFKLERLDKIEIGAEPVYLIDGLLPAGPSFGEIPAPPKSLKSFAVMDMLLHIAMGKEYAGRAIQQGAVVYVTSEGVRGVRRRLIAMRRHHGVDKGIPFFLVSVMPDLGTGTTDRDLLIKAIRDEIKDTQVVAIAIDTMRKATPGRDENSTKDMSPFLANCDHTSTTFSCLTLAVHHSPRSDIGRGAGTNAVEGSADVILPVTRCDKPDGTPRATIKVDRMKDGEEGDSWSFELRQMEVGQDRNGKPVMGAYAVVTDLPAKREDKPVKEKTKNLPKGAVNALSALVDIMADLGEPAPASTRIPSGVKVVTVDRWRDHARRRGISASEDQRAQNKAFRVAGDALVAAGKISTWDGLVWLVR